VETFFCLGAYLELLFPTLVSDGRTGCSAINCDTTYASG
jgi:hypothetical protein